MSKIDEAQALKTFRIHSNSRDLVRSMSTAKTSVKWIPFSDARSWVSATHPRDRNGLRVQPVNTASQGVETASGFDTILESVFAVVSLTLVVAATWQLGTLFFDEVSRLSLTELIRVFCESSSIAQ